MGHSETKPWWFLLSAGLGLAIPPGIAGWRVTHSSYRALQRLGAPGVFLHETDWRYQTSSTPPCGDEDSFYEVEVTLDDGTDVDVQLDEAFIVVGSEAETGADEDDD